jgi:recombination protein RecR
LHGAIAPLEGVGPSQLKIQELLQRIENPDGKTPIREIIMALDADLEGDTTILYLSKLLSGHGIKLSRIAHGVPIGSDIDFIDDRTMGRALENRVEL